MLNRLFCVVAVLILVSTQSIVRANPLTYDFSGILDSPVNGSNQFNGSFTINVNPTVSYFNQLWQGVYPYQISESGNDVSLTATIGGQTTSFVNNPGSIDLANLAVYRNPTNYQTNPSDDTIDVIGMRADSDPGTNAGFGLSLSNPTDVIFSRLEPSNVANLQNFNFGAFNIGYASYTNESGVLDDGTITSVTAIQAPEPDTLAVFAVLALVGILYRHRPASRVAFLGSTGTQRNEVVKERCNR